MIIYKSDTFFKRNSYLLITAAWLLTISFIINNYWSGTSTPYTVEKAIQKTLATGEGQTFWMKSIGIDEKGIQVSEMDFEWSVRAK